MGGLVGHALEIHGASCLVTNQLTLESKQSQEPQTRLRVARVG
jgi:hypothetical protein